MQYQAESTLGEGDQWWSLMKWYSAATQRCESDMLFIVNTSAPMGTSANPQLHMNVVTDDVPWSKKCRIPFTVGRATVGRTTGGST